MLLILGQSEENQEKQRNLTKKLVKSPTYLGFLLLLVKDYRQWTLDE